MSEECIGTKCFEIKFEVADERPHRWQVDGDQNAMGEQRVYPFPELDSGYHTAFFDTNRQRFVDTARKKMLNYLNPVEGVCKENCNCIISEDPKDTIVVESRVPVESQWAFEDGSGAATVFGSFLLTTIRTEGLCTHGEPIGYKAKPKMDELLAKGYSERAIGLITSCKEKK